MTLNGVVPVVTLVTVLLLAHLCETHDQPWILSRLFSVLLNLLACGTTALRGHAPFSPNCWDLALRVCTPIQFLADTVLIVLEDEELKFISIFLAVSPFYHAGCRTIRSGEKLGVRLRKIGTVRQSG